MTNRELDCAIVGFSVGALAFLWIGYRLRVRVERWHALRRVARHQARIQEHDFPVVVGRRPSRAAQTVKSVLAKPSVIPLMSRAPSPSAEVVPVIRPFKADPIPLPWPSPGSGLHWSDPDHPANVTARMIRSDAYDALVEAGFRKVAATAALDACTPEERAGGLESWVTAALRRAAAK